MRRALGLALAVGVVATAAVIVTARTAWADGSSVAVQCHQGQGSGCTVSANSAITLTDSSSSTQGSGGSTCRDATGKVVPCYDPTFGWFGPGGCYWKVDTGYSPPASDTAGQHQGEQGAWWDFTCIDVHNGTGGGIVWLPTAPAGPPPPSPIVLARQAVNRLLLTSPLIDSSPAPDADQLVNLPTWLWIQPSSWRPVSATASVPGESVTATATPRKVTWTMGDGSTVVCQGPGRPYARNDDSRKPSPDCGHTYRRSSADEPNGAYPVSATITWEIRWSGGGQSGSLPALTTTAYAAFRVAESQAVNTSP